MTAVPHDARRSFRHVRLLALQYTRQADPLELPTLAPEGGRTVADLWESQSTAVSDASGKASTAVERADANLLAEMAKERVASTLASSSSSSSGGGGGGGGGGSFMDSIKAATPMAVPEVRPRARSKRSEDEQIRADRRERMAQQGLVGEERESGWRARDRSDADSAPEADVPRSGSSGELQAMLGAGTVSESDADSSLSPEQFTLCAPAAPVLITLVLARA